MKILYLNEYCGYFGGMEQNIADSVLGLSKKGHSCFLAYAQKTSHQSKEFQNLFQNTFLCQELQSSSLRSKEAIDLQEIVKQINPHVFYFHRITSLPSLKILRQAKSVRMIHDHELCCPRGSKYYIFSKKICTHKADWRCTFDGAFLKRKSTFPGIEGVNISKKIKEISRNYDLDLVLVASQFMQTELLQNGFPPEKVKMLPLAILKKDIPFTEVPLSKKILYVGQLVSGKGVDLLLKSLKNINCDFVLDIVGHGKSEKKLKILAQKLNLTSKINFHGWIAPEQLERFYLETQIVVMPSRWAEPFGLVGLEAMYYGRPVVAFAVGGILDWLLPEKTGFLVPEKNTFAFAQALEELLLKPLQAKQYGKNAYEHLRTTYSFDVYIEKLEKFLQMN